ncbi:helix-turn-helix transcriptional regulator [Inquilinus limosus]|uniref:helix-turn-helix transcriptional regulator n=1 Tax=Inquilinus limosus TaxID=171674 RepID=UPI00040E731A|nr:helix-turn-helix transcriptional regulator [Inquilinus limosus]
MLALLDEPALERDDALAALDRLAHGMALVAPGGRVLFLNRAAAAVVAARDGLAIGLGRVLRAWRPAEDAALQRLIAPAESGLAGGCLAVSRPSGARPYAVQAAPLGSALRPADRAPAPAMLLILDPEAGPEPSPATLQRLYGLTTAEARVALLSLRGAGLRPIAEELSVSVSTVRIHLQRVFEKTGTHRQAALVRLLLGAGLIAGK